jgi:tetraacyldisaccharide 4'-kinase
VKDRSGWRWLLWPLSILYSVAARGRARCYHSGVFRARRLPGTVISVGNLTVGGTGKTPLVLWLAERFAEEGKRAAILTRGYRGTVDSATRGEPQSDEVALLRARLSGKVKIGVGADRYKNGAVLAQHGIEWFILDDGFQHLQLRRDADIVLVDATDPFGGGMTLPAGRLREPISALHRADIVVITRSVQNPAPATEALVRRHTPSPVFYASTRIENVLRVPGPAIIGMPRDQWRRVRFLAFCGIGNPAAFFEDLRRWGFQVAGERSFPDHHVYTGPERAELEHAAVSCGADALLCTEKDVWNLRHVEFHELPVYCCRVSLDLPVEEFREAVDQAISRRRGGARQ